MIGRTFHIPAPQPFRESFIAERFVACPGMPSAVAPDCEVVLMGGGMVVVPPPSPVPLRIEDRLIARNPC